jgi:hypothetical protein
MVSLSAQNGNPKFWPLPNRTNCATHCPLEHSSTVSSQFKQYSIYIYIFRYISSHHKKAQFLGKIFLLIRCVSDLTIWNLLKDINYTGIKRILENLCLTTFRLFFSICLDFSLIEFDAYLESRNIFSYSLYYLWNNNYSCVFIIPRIVSQSNNLYTQRNQECILFVLIHSTSSIIR